MRHYLFLLILFVIILTNKALFSSALTDSASYYIEMSHVCRDNDKAKSLLLLNKALKLYESKNETAGIGMSYAEIASWYISGNQWDTSLAISLKAMKYADAVSDSLVKSKVYLNLGIIYYHLKNNELSKQYSRKAKDFGPLNIKASAISNIGLVYTHEGLVDSAYNCFYKANQIFESIDDTNQILLSNIAATNMNLGTIAMDKKEYDKAKIFLNKSLRTCYRIQDYNSIILNYMNFGWIFMYEKNYNLSGEVINRAQLLADSLGFTHLSNDCNYVYSKLMYQMGDYQKAYVILDKFDALKDSLLGVDIENKIANLQTQYDIEKSNQQIKYLENEHKLNTYKTSLIIISLIFLSLIVIYLLVKRSRAIKLKMNQANIHRQETQKKLEKAKNDIIYFTKLIQENNERIECFEKELELINNNSEEFENKREKLRNMKILKDEDWVYYKDLFKEVYADFYDKVTKIPNLTEGDKRQALLFKLGYTIKMSADVLGISTEGIKRARQRLAKKLNLTDAGRLEDFFTNL
ncbi:MAG: hypothetical protein JXR60_01440 [Bacteroidales bacterium]|nr:hypothetical protein [Bacteroidales bacterium]